MECNICKKFISVRRRKIFNYFEENKRPIGQSELRGVFPEIGFNNLNNEINTLMKKGIIEMVFRGIYKIKED